MSNNAGKESAIALRIFCLIGLLTASCAVEPPPPLDLRSNPASQILDFVEWMGKVPDFGKPDTLFTALHIQTKARWKTRDYNWKGEKVRQLSLIDEALSLSAQPRVMITAYNIYPYTKPSGIRQELLSRPDRAVIKFSLDITAVCLRENDIQERFGSFVWGSAIVDNGGTDAIWLVRKSRPWSTFLGVAFVKGLDRDECAHEITVSQSDELIGNVK